jgi:hypothetical protein
MSDPIQVHRLRLISEMSKGNPVLVEDLKYILHAYDTMIIGLKQIEVESPRASIADIATLCLRNIEYIGPTY